MKHITRYLSTKYGNSVLTAREDGVHQALDIPTGISSFDAITGVNGLPVGRLIELFGAASSGKSTLSLQIAAAFQKRNLSVVYMDIENAFQPEYAKKLGLQLNNILRLYPSSCEMALKMIEELLSAYPATPPRKQKHTRKEINLAKTPIGLIIVDSLAALIPEGDLSADIYRSDSTEVARIMSTALKKLCQLAHQKCCSIMFTNHLRDRICRHDDRTIGDNEHQGNADVFEAGTKRRPFTNTPSSPDRDRPTRFNSGETTPGGRALKFYSSMRIELRQCTPILDHKKQRVGDNIQVTFIKNKLASPHQSAIIPLIYGQGFRDSMDSIA